MARMWVRGKAVEVTPEEAVAFAAIADVAPPDGVGRPVTPIRRATGPLPPNLERATPHRPLGQTALPLGPRPLKGMFERADDDTQTILIKLLLKHPEWATADQLNGGRSYRVLARVMANLTKTYGKGRLVKKKEDFKDGKRVLRYRATDELTRNATEDGWGGSR